MQTNITEPVQQTTISSDNAPNVVASNETTTDVKPEIKSEASNAHTLKTNPVMTLDINKKMSVDAKHIADIQRHKKGGFKKSENTVVATIEEDKPELVAASDVEQKKDKLQKTLHANNNIMKKHLSPLFYANMIDNVPLYIAPEKKDVLQEISSNQFISKTNSKVSFSGKLGKCINARKFTFEPGPVVAQYISKSSNTSKTFSGHVKKRISRQPFMKSPEAHKYIFAADHKHYPFSGTVQKSTSLYKNIF